MIPQDSISWLFWLGVGLSMIGLAIGLWRLFGDRLCHLRKPIPRRCARCLYDMKDIEGLLCPECGRFARSERALHRARKQWKSGLACLLLVTPLGVGLAGHRPLFNAPWEKHAPERALFWLLSVANTEIAQRADRELLDRWKHRELSLSTRTLLTSRYLAARNPMRLSVVPIAGSDAPGLLIEATDWTTTWTRQWGWDPGIVHRLTHRVQPQIEGSDEFAAMFTARGFLLRLPDEARAPFNCSVVIEESGEELWRGVIAVE